jgi:hypothetical protein
MAVLVAPARMQLRRNPEQEATGAMVARVVSAAQFL